VSTAGASVAPSGIAPKLLRLRATVAPMVATRAFVEAEFAAATRAKWRALWRGGCETRVDGEQEVFILRHDGDARGCRTLSLHLLRLH
jgi:hypothetical protein